MERLGKDQNNLESLPLKPEELRYMAISFLNKRWSGVAKQFQSKGYEFDDVVSHLVTESLSILLKNKFDETRAGFSTYCYLILKTIFDNLRRSLDTQKSGKGFLAQNIVEGYNVGQKADQDHLVIAKEIAGLVTDPSNPAGLTEKERFVIESLYLNERFINRSEVASELNITNAYVHQLLHSGFKKIREYSKRSRVAQVKIL